jgi:3-oxoadipate enol-lactonase
MEQIKASDGCDIAYRLDGRSDAPVLLLSNSLGATMEMWSPQIPVFSKFFRVLRYDTRGHGDSAGAAGEYSLERLGRDVVELVEALGIDDFVFCGISMGGMIGQWLAIRHPDKVRSLVLANTAARIGSVDVWDERISAVRASGLDAIADTLMARFFSQKFRDNRPDIIENTRQMIADVSAQGYVGCCAAIRDTDLREEIRAITARTLVLCGKYDVSTTLADGECLQHAIEGSQVNYLDAAHLSNIEQPEDFSGFVLSFLDATIN